MLAPTPPGLGEPSSQMGLLLVVVVWSAGICGRGPTSIGAKPLLLLSFSLSAFLALHCSVLLLSFSLSLVVGASSSETQKPSHLTPQMVSANKIRHSEHVG